VTRGRAAWPAAALALLAASCSTLFRDSVPEREGRLEAAGLSAPVEIVRDEWGVPHVAARDDLDLAFAQGFVHAQDRLFQVDTERRLARGELAEVFGPEALPADRLFRHLGFAARAPALAASWPERTRRIVRAYCDGFNAAMAALRQWPAEFRIARYAPRRLAPEDVAALSLLKSFALAQWAEEIALFRLAAHLPPSKFAWLLPRPPGAAAFRAPAGTGAPDSSLLREGLACAESFAGGLPRAGGSNAWAVSGARSATGRPILASDPHLPLSCPSPWYEVHLLAPGVDVYGVSFPGAPGVVIGHNPWIAWGMTNTMLDDADFFVERIDGDRVMFRRRWVPLRRRVERIAVRGGRAEEITVAETPHGPVLSPWFPGVTTALSLRWVGYDGGDPLGALHALNRARNAQEFLAAAALFPHPAQTMVYADAAGRIGLVVAGRIPLRRGGHTLLPVPGDTGEWEWRGTLPFSQNPRLFDPPDGIVVAANVAPLGAREGLYLSRLFEPPDRAARIEELLRGGGPFTVEGFARIQADVRRVFAEPALSLGLGAARRRRNASPLFREAAALLERWDREAAASSPGELLFATFCEKLIENVFRDDMGPGLYEEFARSSRLAWNAFDRLVEAGDSPFLENAVTGRKETLDEVAARSLADAMAFLDHRLGTARSTWAWGRVHQAAFEHPFGRKRYLRRWFTIGPFPVGGDGRTVLKQEFRHGTDFSVVVAPSMRQIVPLGARALARSVIATGQSGHFFEEHYRDQTPLWLAGKTHPVWTERGEIERHARARLLLVPKAP